MKEKVKISDYLFFQEGPGVRNTQYTTSGVKLLNVSNLVDGEIDLSNSDRYISNEEAYGKYKHFLVDEGDLIIASSGIKVDYLDKKVGFIKKEHLPLCMNTSTIRFKALDGKALNIKYFKYYLQSNDFKYQVSKSITGSAQLNYGPSHLKQMTFILYDLDDQNEIVERLDRIDNLIQKHKEVINHLDTLIKARFVEMFGKRMENDEVMLSDIAEFVIGLTYKPENVSKNGTIVLRSGNILNNSLQLKKDVVRVSDVSIPKNKYIKNNDILMCSRNGSARLVGKSCLISDVKEDMSFGAFMTVIRSEYPYFLQSFFSSQYFTSQLTSVATTSVNQITTYMLNGYKTIKPTDDEENTFATFVKQVDKLKVA